MTRTLFKVSILALLNILISPANAKQDIADAGRNATSTVLKEEIEDLVENYAQNNIFEGVVLVEKSGEVIFEKAYGASDRENKKVFEIQSAIPIASLTKPMTSTLVLMLAEQGKVDLDSALSAYFPGFDNETGKKITLHHLLSHTSGLPNHFNIDRWFDPEFHTHTSDDEFVSIIATLPLSSAPGTRYEYSNLGYFLLGKIIEVVMEKPYQRVFDEMLFSPLKMEDTTFVFDSPSIPVKGYQWANGGGYREQSGNSMRLLGAGGAIQSSVSDLFRFQEALHGMNLISENSKKLIFAPNSPYSWNVNRINLAPNKSVTVHSYDGKFDGYSAMLTRFVEHSHSIIILSNTGTSFQLKQQLTSDIASVLYNLPVTSREQDVVFTLVNSLVDGNYGAVMQILTRDNKNLVLEEHSLSALAFEVLWSGLADESLQLFSLVTSKFDESQKAKENLLFACNHRLTNTASNKEMYCK